MGQIAHLTDWRTCIKVCNVQSTGNETQMVTAAEAASTAKVAITTIYRWCWAGKIPGATRFGKAWMIPADFEGVEA